MSTVRMSSSSQANPMISIKGGFMHPNYLTITSKESMYNKNVVDDRMNYSSTSESSQEQRKNQNNLMERRKQSESDMVLQSQHSESEEMDMITRNAPLCEPCKIEDQTGNRFNFEAPKTKRHQSEFEIHLKNLEVKMADLVRSSKDNMADINSYSMKQQLLQKVEDIKIEFEKCSKLISTQKNEDSVQPNMDEKKKLNRDINKVILKERNRKHLKKDYLNCTPVIQVEICNEEQSPFRNDNGGKTLDHRSNENERIIRKSLTRIIEKNIRNPSAEKSTERRKISNLKTQSSIKSPLIRKNKESESLTRSSTINEPKSRRYLERIKNQFNQGSKQVPLTSRDEIFDTILPNRSKSFFTSPREKCLDRKTMNHEPKFGREAFISSPRGQELMRKYQGKYKMVNLDTSCSMSRNSSKSSRDNPFMITKKENPACKLKTTNAKEFREILRQSVQSKHSESLIQHFESEKEVKMNDLDLDFSSRKESLITKHEENSDHNCDRSNKDIAPKLDISSTLVTPNNSEKKVVRHMRTYLDKSSMKTNQPKYQRRLYQAKKLEQNNNRIKRRTRDERAYDYNES